MLVTDNHGYPRFYGFVNEPPVYLVMHKNGVPLFLRQTGQPFLPSLMHRSEQSIINNPWPRLPMTPANLKILEKYHASNRQ